MLRSESIEANDFLGMPATSSCSDSPVVRGKPARAELKSERLRNTSKRLRYLAALAVYIDRFDQVHRRQLRLRV